MKIKSVILFSGMVLILSSCVKRKNTDPVPTITYENFIASDENTAYITINYTDGDGDIFAEKDSKDNNFFAWFYYKDTDGSFKPALWPLVIPNPPNPDTTIYNERPIAYTVFRPSDLSKDQPIKGQITITLEGWRSDSKYKNFKYKIYMVDQKGNRTEEVMTPEIVVPF
jgi:hypothetical protein